ncbi:DNA-binding XRE family transcriptional regulator [Duganella sp. 1411]|nr:DNA-binding XRE family transcriptional regulator [Duganella sp. 1411]
MDYIAPHWHHTEQMLDGLRTTMLRTKGMPSILRADIASFGFVYIHPMSDGNGRISRFLVNDILRRDGAVPAPFIIPISATITDNSRERAGYDRALEALSKPEEVDQLVSFGRVLRQLRKDAGLTQERLALEAGIERNYVSLIERGINQPALRMIFKLADALGTTPSEILRQVEAELAMAPALPSKRRT